MSSKSIIKEKIVKIKQEHIETLMEYKSVTEREIDLYREFFQSYKARRTESLSKLRMELDEMKIWPKAKAICKKKNGRMKISFGIQQRCILMAWLKDNFENPYPSNLQKQKLMEETGLSLTQINNCKLKHPTFLVISCSIRVHKHQKERDKGNH